MSDRNSSIDRACIDAETLAMWADGALPAAQAAAVEAHVADCARCQELVATFALTEPEAVSAPASVAVRAPWLERLWRQRYWLPLSGLAAASVFLILAVARSQDETASQPVTQTAQADTAAPQTIAPRAEAQPTPTPAPPTVAAQKPTPTTTAPKRESLAKAGAADQTTTQTTAAAPMAVPPPPPPPPPPPAQMPAPVVVAPVPAAPAPRTIGGVVGGVVGGVAGGVAGRASAGVELRASADRNEAIAARTIEFESPRSTGGRGGGGARANTAMSVTALPTVAHWRIVGASRVQRSVDGVNWTTIDLGPELLELSAGAAPSNLVCWLVGRSGVVLRSADGVTFARVSFPEPLDLMSVTATNVTRASVTAVGGRQFTTDDGGLTWKER